MEIKFHNISISAFFTISLIYWSQLFNCIDLNYLEFEMYETNMLGAATWDETAIRTIFFKILQWWNAL